MNDLLTFEKIEAGMLVLTIASTPLLEFLRNTVKLQFIPALSKNINITITPLSVDEDLSVEIDPKKIGLVFGNLLSNAVKFTPASGTIDITVEVEAFGDSGAPCSPPYSWYYAC